MRRDRMRWAVLAVLLAAAGTLAHAKVPRDFQRVLALLQPAQRERLQEQAAAWSAWPRVDRDAFAGRARAWDAASLHERRSRRDSWQAWRLLTDAERRRLQAEAARIGTLAAAEQADLRARFERLDATTQRGWRLGPVLGADYARLQPLLAQVPADQHAPLLRVLRAMTPVQRADLAVLVQRTPPAERDRLRRELVSTSQANRDGWLRLSLER